MLSVLNQSANITSSSTPLVSSSTLSVATNQARYDNIPMLSIATNDNLLKFKEATRDISPYLAYAKIDPTQRIAIGLSLSNSPPNFTEVECLQWHEFDTNDAYCVINTITSLLLNVGSDVLSYEVFQDFNRFIVEMINTEKEKLLKR